MDLYELLTTSIDDLYDQGILEEPAPERNKKMLNISLVCSQCGEKHTDRYGRQNPDKLALSMNCPRCGAYTWQLVKAIPYTIHYRSRAMTHASFCDDVAGECWECGRKKNLMPYMFSNRQEVKVCEKHFKAYHRGMFLLRQKHVPGSRIPGFEPLPRFFEEDWY